ncbi:hypothetical protein BH23PAT1_BH23PAT1_3090 [soil metagenome]
MKGTTIRRFTGIKKPRVSIHQLILFTVAAGFLFILLDMKNTKEVNTVGLLDTIAKGESNGNYNAYYGNVRNTDPEFTAMTVGEVLAWQSDFVKKGSPSSAVGKYQFIRPTLHSLVDELKIDQTARFDENLQDTLAVALLKRRGIDDYAKGNISREKFANNLSKEWAALPKVIGDKPNESYYAGDGQNKERVTVEEVYKGIATLAE